LTKKGFLKQANAICAQGFEEMNRADWLPGSGTNRTLPRGDEHLVDEILTAWEEGVEEVREEPSLMRDASANSGFNRAYRMSEKYGLHS
jgi:hypothetical protein